MKIGKANLEIKSEGCMDCGSRGSHDWVVARVLQISIDGGKPFPVAIHRCAECIETLKQKLGEQQTQELPLA